MVREFIGSFGEFLALKRKDAGITIKDMAQKLKISAAYYSYFESGDRKAPERDVQDQIADILELSPPERLQLYDLAGQTRGIVAADLIRPILRGRDVKRYEFDYSGLWLISTFPSLNIDIDCYPAIKNHLLSFGYERLEQSGRSYIINGEKVKSRKKTNNKWFETQDSISYWDEFSKQKIVWARLMRISKTEHLNFPRFALIEENFVVQDSLCFITGKHLPLLCALLNSDMAIYYYFTQIASLDEGGLQMRQQYIEQFPIPDLNNEIANRITELLGSPLGPNVSVKLTHVFPLASGSCENCPYPGMVREHLSAL